MQTVAEFTVRTRWMRKLGVFNNVTLDGCVAGVDAIVAEAMN